MNDRQEKTIIKAIEMQVKTQTSRLEISRMTQNKVIQKQNTEQRFQIYQELKTISNLLILGLSEKKLKIWKEMELKRKEKR
jgi:thymidylate synthase